MPTLSPFPGPSGKEGTSSHHQAGQQYNCLMQADVRRDHGGQSLRSDEIRLWYLFGMPGHVLLFCCLPALCKFCCLFRTEELMRHAEDVTLLFLDMVLDILSE